MAPVTNKLCHCHLSSSQTTTSATATEKATATTVFHSSEMSNNDYECDDVSTVLMANPRRDTVSPIVQLETVTGSSFFLESRGRNDGRNSLFFVLSLCSLRFAHLTKTKTLFTHTLILVVAYKVEDGRFIRCSK